MPPEQEDDYPDQREIKKFLLDEQYAPSILSSKTIAEFALRNGQLDKAGYTNGLIGEAQFRQWLYNGDAPQELIDLLDRDDVKKRIKEESNSKSIIESYFDERKQDIDSASGIIAVVHTKHKEAIPIAFEICQGIETGVYDTSEERVKVPDWSKDLKEIAKGENAKFNKVNLKVPLGPFLKILSGKSHMLALAISMNSTKTHAREVIATGKIQRGRIESSIGLEQKSQLARRMNAMFVSIPKESVKVNFEVKDKESLRSFIVRWKKEFGQKVSVREKLRALLDDKWAELLILASILSIGLWIYQELQPQKDFSHQIICNHHDCNGTLFQKLDGGTFYYACSMYWQNRGNKLMCGKKEDRTTPLICKNHKKNELVVVTKNGLEVLGCPLEKCDYQFSFVQCKKHSDSKMVFLSDGESSLLKCPKSGCKFSYPVLKTTCEKHNQEILDFHSSNGQKTDGCPRCNYYSAKSNNK